LHAVGRREQCRLVRTDSAVEQTGEACRKVNFVEWNEVEAALPVVEEEEHGSCWMEFSCKVRGRDQKSVALEGSSCGVQKATVRSRVIEIEGGRRLPCRIWELTIAIHSQICRSDKSDPWTHSGTRATKNTLSDPLDLRTRVGEDREEAEWAGSGAITWWRHCQQ